MSGLTLLAAGALYAKETPSAPGSRVTLGTNEFTLVSPGPADGRIAFITAKMLEQLQYQRQPFGDSVSSKFLDRYLETLDPQHIHFLQSDVTEFERYRTNLDNLTIPRTQVADTRPGCEIFNRFVQRLAERVEYADQLLGQEDFKFENDERITINRREMPYPKDLAEAKQLWQERLRYEYLQERLGKADAKKRAEKDPRAPTETNAPSASVKKDTPPKSEREQIVDTLSHRYHRNLRTFSDWDNDDVLQIYLTALAHVYDPHSDYFNQEQLDSFSIGMNLSLFGIGAELTTSEDGYCTIRRLLPGGPAEKSKKIKEKDRIINVAQSNQPPVDVVDMALNKAVQLIRGPKGTEVRLTVEPDGGDSSKRFELNLVRDEIKLDDQAAKSTLIELPAGQGANKTRVGIIDLPSFYATFDPSNSRGKAPPRSTSADVAKLLVKLKKEKVDGIILDLRRNGGGSLEEAIRLTGLFIKQGPVVQVRDSDGSVQEDSDEDPTMLYDGPLVVLTSRFSASASEIVAGALQDYGRALVVGDSSTHGKGTVQSVNTLKPFMRLNNVVWTNEPGALKVTIKKFYRASGASTQLKGVVPDIVLPSVISESKDIGESALENPMPWDTIQSSKFEKLNAVAPYVGELRRRSAQRIAQDKDFAYIREDIEHFKKLQADKTVSLKEQVRVAEKEEAEARQKARDKERRSRPDPKETVYEITLKQVDLPGLPTPVQKTNSLASASVKSGAVTNDSAALTPSSEDPLDDILDDEKAPAVDPAMTEAKRILVDYLSILAKANVVAVGK